MPYSTLVLPEHSWLKNKSVMYLRLGCPSLLRPSGLVCKRGGTPLLVICKTEIKLMNADALPVMGKKIPHELLIDQGYGKIDY